VPILPLIPKERLIQEIGAAYSGSASRIMAILRELHPESFHPMTAAAAMHRIRSIVSALDAEAVSWAASSINAAYMESKGVTRVKLEAIGAKPSRKYDQARHAKAIDKRARAAARYFLDANGTILATAGKYLSALAHARKKLDTYREEAALEAFTSAEARKLVNSVVARGAAEHIPAQGVGRMILDRLMGILGEASFIEINGRNFNLKAYSELVARTTMREAQTDATKELCREYDNDLVQYSQHDSPCAECAQYEGEIYSLSGDSPDYDQLPPEAEPPTHPNCEHSLNPVSENSLRWRSA
jgi:hypothetical protein